MGLCAGSPHARRRLGRVQLDPAQVLGVDVSVLVRADEAQRRAVVAVERLAVELVGQQHVVGERVLERRDRPVAVELPTNLTWVTGFPLASAGSTSSR